MKMGGKQRRNNQPSTGMAQVGGDGNESVWGQRGDEGIEYRTLAGQAITRAGCGRQYKYQPTTGAAKAVKAAGDESVGDRMTACDERQQ